MPNTQSCAYSKLNRYTVIMRGRSILPCLQAGAVLLQLGIDAAAFHTTLLSLVNGVHADTSRTAKSVKFLKQNPKPFCSAPVVGIIHHEQRPQFVLREIPHGVAAVAREHLQITSASIQHFGCGVRGSIRAPIRL